MVAGLDFKMSIFSEAGLTHFYRMGVNLVRERTLRRRFMPVGIAVAFSISIALLIYARHLIDLSVPVDGDVRAHIFKIDIVYNYLSHFSWPEWIPYWYHGYPFDLYYPPGFYILGAGLTFIVRNTVIAYKLMLFFALVSNGLVTYYFARRFLKLGYGLSILCLIAYESSTPLLVNYLYGEGPNLTGWSISLIFLIIYLGNVPDGKTSGLRNIRLPGFLLGTAILIHPFPVIFVTLAVAFYHIIWLVHKRAFRAALRLQLPFLIAVYLTGGIIGAHYWLPAFLNLKYVSSIYTMTEYMWPGGMTYVLILCALAITAGLAARPKIRGDLRLDFLIACLFLAAALGFGVSRYFPFGLGVLLHEFRFATIMAPFFAVLLIVFLLSYRPVVPDKNKMLLALASSIFLVAIVFVKERQSVISFYTGVIIGSSPDARLSSLAQFLRSEFPLLAVLALFSSLILSTVFSLDFKSSPDKRRSLLLPLAASVCLILLTSVVPIAATYNYANLSRLFTYVASYETPGYAEIMQRAKEGRLIVPMIKGSLCEGDSPVTFGWRWDVQTVNGPYSQGDPKFFRHTVHLEWEDRWLDNKYTRENLMEESAARYIFVRSSRPLPADMNGLATVVSNTYGKLLEFKQAVSRAVVVTPVLLDVKNPGETADFFNILIPNGYRMVFVDAGTVNAGLKEKFDYVLTDDRLKLPEYRDKQVFLLSDIENGRDIGVTEYPGVVILKFPYRGFINRFFYHGDRGNGMGWVSFDAAKASMINPPELTLLETMGNLMGIYLGRLDYQPAGYSYKDNKTELKTRPGFTLVKDSYFPYWSAAPGKIMPTSQGFMLVYSDEPDVVLDYKKPLLNTAATVITLVSFMTAAVMLAVITVKKPDNKTTIDR